MDNSQPPAAKVQLFDQLLAILSGAPGTKMTARQIAEAIVQKYPEQSLAKKERSAALSSDDDLVSQIAAEIGARLPDHQRKDPNIKVTISRPRKYYYSFASDADEVAAAESRVTQSEHPKTTKNSPTQMSSEKWAPAKMYAGKRAPTKMYAGKRVPPRTSTGKRVAVQTSSGNSFSPRSGEHELYPLLSSYLVSDLRVHSMRIDEKTSSNQRGKNGNKWLHPDLVGIEDLGADWHPEARDCAKLHSDNRVKLWSFEVKKLINRSNARECFFQAVSNSSWANFGYLVAAEIVGEDTLSELRLLSAAHGIGLINLNRQNPSESEIVLPARDRGALDWGMISRLAEENSDFLNYVRLIKQFHQTGMIKPHDWDALRSKQ